MMMLTQDEGVLLSRDGSMLFVPTKKSATERGLRAVSAGTQGHDMHNITSMGVRGSDTLMIYQPTRQFTH